MVVITAVVPVNSIVAALGKKDESPRPNELFKVPSEAQLDDRLTEEISHATCTLPFSFTHQY